MFAVPRLDGRLRNKAEVLSLLVPDETGTRRPVAIAADLLRRTPVYHFEAGGRRFVVVTTKAGANRVYDAAQYVFAGGADRVADEGGTPWRVTEDALVSEQRRLPRVAARRTFWFAWQAQFPTTLLFK